MASALCQFCEGKGTLPAQRSIFEKSADDKIITEELEKNYCEADNENNSSFSQNIFNKENHEDLNNDNNNRQTECSFCKGMGIVDMPFYA